MNVCFIMYPWEDIDPENDTSLALIKECVKRGHGVVMCSPANLTIRDSVTNAFCTVIGIDVIGGKLVEVNVMSPSGITYINKVYKLKVKIEVKVIDFLESKVLDKLQAFDRRTRLRKTVEEA